MSLRASGKERRIRPAEPPIPLRKGSNAPAGAPPHRMQALSSRGRVRADIAAPEAFYPA
jgi:hypothetical protein